jgi:hypothetical protein
MGDPISPIRLTVSPPLFPQGSDWQEMVRLRDACGRKFLGTAAKARSILYLLDRKSVKIACAI